MQCHVVQHNGKKGRLRGPRATVSLRRDEDMSGVNDDDDDDHPPPPHHHSFMANIRKCTG